MRKTGQKAKAHSPTASASANADVAQFGDFLPAVINVLESLELVFRSKTPEQEVREAMTDKPHPLPHMLPKNFPAKKRQILSRKVKIRESLIALLEAIDHRDHKFFSDMARYFKTKHADTTGPVASDPLRLEVSVQRHIQENDTPLKNEDLPTLKQLEDATGYSNRSTERAVSEIGLNVRQGRAKKSAN
jgi:hypothetical protein